MQWIFLLAPLLVSGCINAVADSNEAGEDVPSGSPDDYLLRFDPEPGSVIGVSSQSLVHEFNVTNAVRLDAWAAWDRPYASIHFSISGPNGVIVNEYRQPTGPTRIDKELDLEPGSYRVRMTALGVHLIHAFETGGTFSALETD